MKISACIIAKNEEKNITRLLRSIVGKFDEIILVDTGSTDKTKEIAKSFGCRVIEHKWKGFADARNRAVEEASGEWLWHFDADFELEEEEYRKALVYLKRLPEEVDGVLIGVRNLDSFGKVKGISSQVFIHRKREGLVWKGKVHEFVNAKFVVGLPIYVNHYGYANYKVQLKKAYRNLELLKEEIEGLNPAEREYKIKLFYLVQTYSILSYEDKDNLIKVKERALEFLKLIEGEEDSFGFFAIYIYNYLLDALERLNEEELYEKYIKEILSKEPTVPDFFLKAFFFFKKRRNVTKAYKYLTMAAVVLDDLEEASFKSGLAYASDRLTDFYKIVLSEDLKKDAREFPEIIDFVDKKWKEKKGGRYLGMLLSSLYDDLRKEHLLRKLALRYRYDDLVVSLYLDYLLNTNLSKLKFEITKFCDVSVSMFFLARVCEIEGNLKDALIYYTEYLEKTRDTWVARYLLDKYSWIREFVEKTKKGRSTSDNKN